MVGPATPSAAANSPSVHGPAKTSTDSADSRAGEGAFGEPGWEEWMTFIRDSEGNLVGLASRHAPES
jgi:hypothetical protein